MKKIFEDILLTGLGTLVVTKEKAEEVVEKMINQGDVTREEGRELLEKFKEKADQGKNRFSERFMEELENKLSQAGFVTKEEIEDLKERIDNLEQQIHELQEQQKE